MSSRGNMGTLIVAAVTLSAAVVVYLLSDEFAFFAILALGAFVLLAIASLQRSREEQRSRRRLDAITRELRSMRQAISGGKDQKVVAAHLEGIRAALDRIGCTPPEPPKNDRDAALVHRAPSELRRRWAAEYLASLSEVPARSSTTVPKSTR